jgi:annexin A7/11
LAKTINDKFSGSLEEACLLLLQPPVDVFCEKIKAAVGGIGCDEDTLARVLGGLDKREARAVADRYRVKYGRDLVEKIKNETGGNFEDSLVAWLTLDDPTGGFEYVVNPTPDQFAFCVAQIKHSVADLDVDLLKRAIDGVGTDERLVCDVLCNRTKSQMDAIDLIYRDKHKRTLKEYIEREMGGNLETFFTYMQMSEQEFDSYILHKAFTGFGTNEAAIIEIVCTQSYARLAAARTIYEARTDENLLDRVHGELDGPLENLCVRPLSAPSRRVSQLQCGFSRH